MKKKHGDFVMGKMKSKAGKNRVGGEKDQTG
jgi:hypothetical protein